MSDQPAAALPDGDASDFDAFYRESRGRLLAQLYAFTSDRGDAQECLAEAYMRAWQRWSQISRYDAPEAWCGRSRSGSRSTDGGRRRTPPRPGGGTAKLRRCRHPQAWYLPRTRVLFFSYVSDPTAQAILATAVVS
jgi:hypothetical protein